MEPPRSFRLLVRINETVICGKIPRSEHFPRNLHEWYKRALALETGYQLSEEINLTRVTYVMLIQTEGSA